MKFKGRLKPEFGLSTQDIAPFLSLAFLLILFLLFVPGFLTQPQIKVSLPKAVTSGSISVNNLEVSIDAQRTLFVNAKPVSLSELEIFFKEYAKRNGSLTMRADSRLALGEVTKVLDLARQIGISRINIITSEK